MIQLRRHIIYLSGLKKGYPSSLECFWHESSFVDVLIGRDDRGDYAYLEDCCENFGKEVMAVVRVETAPALAKYL